MDMQGKTVVITGASRGIGAETARVFAQAGANVALLARDGKAISALAEEIGTRALALPCDVSHYAALEDACFQTKTAFGSLDVLINNAGMIEPISHLAQVDPDEWGRAVDVNLKGVFNGIRATLPLMIATGGGSIFTVSSGAASHPIEGWSPYCASKAGARMLTQCLHLENAKDGIRAMGLSPGTVATQMQREIKASGINPVSQLDWSVHIPPDWPARALLWMCSDQADEYCGEELSLRDENLRKRMGLQ